MPVQLPPIDDDVYAALQAQAVPLEDDVNSVLRRLLGVQTARAHVTAQADVSAKAASASRPQARRVRSPRGSGRLRTRAPKGSILPEEDYELPILRTLEHLGGRVPTREAIAQVEREIGPKLTPADRQELSSGGLRWQNRVQFVRLRLIEKGEMVAGSPRGVWEISPAGRNRVQEAG